MSERKDEQWLDKQLQRAVDGSTPVFDAESWKRTHRDEYEVLLARSGPANRRRVRLLTVRWLAGLAAAAAVVLAVGSLLGRMDRRPSGPTVPDHPVVESPAGIMSMMSLRIAYQQGGFDALDQQLQDTLDEFRPRSSSVSIRGLF